MTADRYTPCVTILPSAVSHLPRHLLPPPRAFLLLLLILVLLLLLLRLWLAPQAPTHWCQMEEQQKVAAGHRHQAEGPEPEVYPTVRLAALHQ